MSPGSILKDAVAPLKTSRSDQRRHRRYRIKLELEYNLLNKKSVDQSGSGRTLNISAGGIFFETKDLLPAGGLIALVMRWPILLDGTCPLKLLVRGRIVRTDAKGAAVKVRSYEFRTSKVRWP